MYCPKCGQSEQAAESFCRQCGLFLPDLSKPVRVPNTPQEHILVNTVLSSMTIGACAILAVLLYLMLAFRPDTHPLIYVTGGFLIAMAAWHVQSLWRSLQLRKHFRKNEEMRLASLKAGESETGKLLEHANLQDLVPNSVTERTTRDLSPTLRDSA
jgi:hypothetical protein